MCQVLYKTQTKKVDSRTKVSSVLNISVTQEKKIYMSRTGGEWEYLFTSVKIYNAVFNGRLYDLTWMTRINFILINNKTTKKKDFDKWIIYISLSFPLERENVI